MRVIFLLVSSYQAEMCCRVKLAEWKLHKSKHQLLFVHHWKKWWNTIYECFRKVKKQNKINNRQIYWLMKTCKHPPYRKHHQHCWAIAQSCGKQSEDSDHYWNMQDITELSCILKLPQREDDNILCKIITVCNTPVLYINTGEPTMEVKFCVVLSVTTSVLRKSIGHN